MLAAYKGSLGAAVGTNKAGMEAYRAGDLDGELNAEILTNLRALSFTSP